MAVGGSPKRRAAAARAPARAPEPAPAPVRRQSRFRVTEAGVATVALLLSGSAFFGNLALYMRGSSIAVLQPKEFLMYRDTGPSGSDLYVGMPVAMINAASADYGDVVTSATITFRSAENLPARFTYDAVVEPVMSSQLERDLANCALGARCIAETGFFVVERPAKLLDVPGGTSRTEYLSFMVSPASCIGSSTACQRFVDFDTAIRTLRGLGPVSIRVDLNFHFDGHKTVECRLPSLAADRAAIFDYAVSRGWAMPGCEISTSNR